MVSRWLLGRILVLFLTVSAVTTASAHDVILPEKANTSSWAGGGDGIWRRNAVWAETVTFDPCNAHSPSNGQYHYHEDPVCLRYQLNDNITGTNVGTPDASFTESTSNLTHSPILGFAYDGHPVYGPYGYCKAKNPNSGICRMTSSFKLRSKMTVRHTLPAWAALAQGMKVKLTSSQYGPSVNSTYPLGRYVEDYEYVPGSGKLDAYNGRFCITPDFPDGVYAYFVTIDSEGQPAFPYYMGLQFYGSASGGSVNSITESTTVYFENHELQTAASTEPQLAAWYLGNSDHYAQILNETNLAAGPVEIWPGVSSPIFAEIQEIQSSTDYVYLSTSGLAGQMMGPWYLNSEKTQPFTNYPTDQNLTTRIPLTMAKTRTKTATQAGANGVWANGVAMYNMLDYYSWSNAEQEDVGPSQP